MPEINLSDVQNLVLTKAPDRTTSATFGTSPVESLSDQATNLRPSSTTNNNDRSVAGTSRDPSRAQQRLPYGGSQGGLERVGFIITSDLWMSEDRALALHAGPSSANWSLALRAQDEENKGGHARYAQARRSSSGGHNSPEYTYFDFPKVQFSFQAGNILPIAGYGNELTMAHGLQDFHKFFEILNQPPLIPSGVNEGKHNYTWVFYTSLQLPQVTLKGYFDPDGVTWEDSAENPVMLNWSSSFTVHEMTPNLWESSELEEVYLTTMKENTRFF